MSKPNTGAVRDMMKNAKRAASPKEKSDVWDGKYDSETGLPSNCPVVPLGVAGDVCHYLDAARQLRTLNARDHSRLGLQSLFGVHARRLYLYWPRVNADGNVTGWRPELAAESLMGSAFRRGVWDVFDRVRGKGAWLGENGELVLHCGDKIWQGPGIGEESDGRWIDPGALGRYVYPACAPGPRPHSRVITGGPSGPAHTLLHILRTWNFRRGEVDAMLLLGWIGAAMLGGALKWRPLAWLTGGQGTGKSTLHDLLKRIFDDALVSVSDASAAGVWQKLGQSTEPVALDELEAEEDNRKAQNVIKLARQAASGGVVLRGGADHRGTEFVARSCFLFSSILVPPLLGQDRSRMAILELGQLTHGAKPPALAPAPMRELGAQLRRRLAVGWFRLGHALEVYRAALVDNGHTARGADQFGTLLACADVMLHDHETDTDSAQQFADKLRAADLAEHDDDMRDEYRCLAHLMTCAIDPFRSGGRKSVSEWVGNAAVEPGDFASDGALGVTDPVEANRVLGTYGMKVVTGGKTGRRFLAVANYHQALSQLFGHTHWAGRSGTMGVWAQALRRLPGAERSGTLWFAGAAGKATLVPLEVVLPQKTSSA